MGCVGVRDAADVLITRLTAAGAFQRARIGADNGTALGAGRDSDASPWRGYRPGECCPWANQAPVVSWQSGYTHARSQPAPRASA